MGTARNNEGMGRLSNDEVHAAGLSDWRILASKLHATFETGDFRTGADFVAGLTELAERADHHPEVRLSYPRVSVQLSSHDIGGLSERDVNLAREISALAADRGISGAPAELALLELALDTADPAGVGAFWSAVLTGTPDNVDGDDVIDPRERVPLLWLQRTDPHAAPRQRFHRDLWLGREQVEDRIVAALAAGGTVVDDSPETFTVLADPEGNKVCLCVAEGR